MEFALSLYMDDLKSILDETIAMERKFAVLYHNLAGNFTKDHDFWTHLAAQEEYHGIIIRGAKDYFIAEQLFPLEALDPDLSNIKNLVETVTKTVDQYNLQTPSKEAVLLHCLELENTSGEFYFRFALLTSSTAPAFDLLRKLVGDEHDHVGMLIDMLETVRRRAPVRSS